MGTSLFFVSCDSESTCTVFSCTLRMSLRGTTALRRKFSRTSSQRRLMFKTLATSLVQHGQIQTTVPKAKELRRFVDKMVTLSKEGTQSARSKAASFLTSQDAVTKLFLDYADRYTMTTLIVTRNSLRPLFPQYFTPSFSVPPKSSHTSTMCNKHVLCHNLFDYIHPSTQQCEASTDCG